MAGFWSGIRGLVLLTAGILVLAASGVMLWGQVESMDTIGQRLQTAAPWLTLLRISLITAVIAAWPRIVPWLTQHPPARTALLAARWRVAAWLVLLELILGQGLIQAVAQSLGL